MNAISSLNRYRGAMLGLAVGAAVGTAVEFESPGSFVPLEDMIGGCTFSLEPGEWTDDTSMALCLAESLVERGGLYPVDQLERYSRWWREVHTVSSALHRFEQTREPYCGSTDPNTAGNGSIMRLAPVPLAYA